MHRALKNGAGDPIEGDLLQGHPLAVSDRGYLLSGNEMTKAPVPDRGSHILTGTSEGRLA